MAAPFTSAQSDLSQIIDDVKNKYAPDKRTAVFNVEIIEENGKLILKGETNLPEAKKELLSKMSEEFEDQIELLPDEDLGEKIAGVVNLSVCNIRSTPQHSAELVTQALLGTPINILKKKGGWYYIQTPDKYIGWVDDDGIHPMTQDELKTWENSDKIIYTELFGVSYSKKDQSSIPVSDVVYGNIFSLQEKSDDFYMIKYPDGRSAYLPADKVKGFHDWLSSLKINKENIIKTSMLLMGVPYLWGGTSVKGVDCSGFTKTVYFLNGIMLPRDASQQVHVGEIVDTENGFESLQPGDLLFFGRKETDSTSERITHVGIYIGENEFIHSSGSVKINSLDKDAENFSEYRFRTFVRAKRILSSLDSNGVVTLKNSK